MEAGGFPNLTNFEVVASQNKSPFLTEEADQTDSKVNHTDVKGFSRLNRSEKEDEVVMPEEYNMKHSNRGYAIIFNQKVFEAKFNLNERRGTDVDKKNLYETFLTLGFHQDKIQVFDDLSFAKIKETLKKIAEEDHSTNDCIVVAVCSYGDEGFLYGYDGKYRSEDLWEPFTTDRCLGLAGKPKLFFIQACRLNEGLMMTETESNKYYKMPTYSDFLIMFSTVPGSYSWNKAVSGSWFIQALCRVISSCFREEHLMDMLTIVNHSVAKNNERFFHDWPNLSGMKQIPSVVSMLTRKLYFRCSSNQTAGSS